jgi:phosphoserine aminotransferase
MDRINTAKAKQLYEALDSSDGFYRGRVVPRDRSKMNVVFNLAHKDLEDRFVAEAEAAGFSGLTGHRSIGGRRASLYNGLELSAVEKLIDFMRDFKSKH